MSTATEENSLVPAETPIRSKIGLWLGPLVFISMILFVELDPANPLVTRMAAVIPVSYTHLTLPTKRIV